ncbi:hypothetical protein WG908_03095 [Sphingobium sp. AN641]|uniref:hypothetical protein n=1 Tax=Sphingobium sp. AN641 TaxID=3133443 RepID=UPI0030C20202
MATSTGEVTVPSDTSVRELMEPLQRKNPSVVWESTGGRSGIIRLRTADKLTGKVVTIALELTEMPGQSDPAACASGMSLINRMEADGNVLTGVEAQTIILGMLQKIREEAAAAETADPAPVPATPRQPQASAATEPLINGCYHLESCAYSKVLSVETIKEQGGERLLRASLQRGEVSDATGAPADMQRIRWDDEPATIYAFCSTRSPAIAWRQDSAYLAEEFDFASGGVAGVQQDSANTYQALCHNIYDNSLANIASSLGYRPLQDGGRGQFTINNPAELFAGR